MTASDPAGRAELTDDELDSLLRYADDELLHRIQATVDPAITLTAVMDIGTAGAEQARPGEPAHADQAADTRRRVAAILVVILLIAAVGMLAFELPRPGAAPGRLAGNQTPLNYQPPLEVSARNQAVTWILQHVSRAAVVSCDPQLCAALVNAGFPAADIDVLEPSSDDPLGSVLVVATGPIRAQYGSRLTLIAPTIITSFGSGTARIDIRLVHGTDKHRDNHATH